MFLKPLLPALLLVSCSVYQLTQANDSKDVCKRVQENLGKKALLCVGKMRNTLLIVTRDFHFYQIPLTSLNGTIDKLYLGDYPAKAIKDSWPKLWADKGFQGLVAKPSRILDAYTVADSHDDYVIFETNKANEDYATLYGINKQYVARALHYNAGDKHLCLLSSDKLNNYYQLTRNSDYMSGNLTIMRWAFSGTDIRKVTYAEAVEKDLYRMCTNGSSKIKVVKDQKASCTSVDWPVLTGFQANGQFYLFGDSYIFTFPEAAYEKPSVPVGLKKTSYGDFIQCGGPLDDRAGDVSKKSPVKFGLIVAIILIVLILLLCCILCLFREAMARKKKKEDKNERNNSFFAASARSTGLSGFGVLSKKASGGPSKRSKQGASPGTMLTKVTPSGLKRSGLKPRAGTVSHKGGTPNISKRSKGNPNAGDLSRVNSRAASGNKATRRLSRGRGASRKTSNRSNRATERSKFKNR